MKNLVKFGIISFAFGLIIVSADVANAQNRGQYRREYRHNVREARQDYRRDVRSGSNPWKERQDYRNDVRDARRDYRQDVRRGNGGWYWYNGGRRLYYPYSTYYYRNGRFIRRN